MCNSDIFLYLAKQSMTNSSSAVSVESLYVAKRLTLKNSVVNTSVRLC
jgi:hypothetical protein